jgi:uncharacterized radical SAM superfamily protein
MTGNVALDELLRAAWEVRTASFPPRIEFVCPAKTLPVSVTGRDCHLNCAHCGGRYLENMAGLQEALDGKKGDRKSYLVSGGCDRQGSVPLPAHLEGIRQLARRGRLNLHTGLVGKEDISELAQLAEVVSFDFVTDEQTIAEVYGLAAGSADKYLESYRRLRRRTRVVPHLCLGLKGGQMQGELAALASLQREGTDAISFIVFRPTPGTAYADRKPPPVAEAVTVIATARLMFPSVPLYLGCLRPGGTYRSMLDSLAVRAGVNKIVQPSPAARDLAALLGLEITRTEECCSL